MRATITRILVAFIIATLVALIFIPAKAQGQYPNRRRYDPYVEVSGASHYRLKGDTLGEFEVALKAMAPTPYAEIFPGTDAAFHFIARFDGDRADFAGGETLLMPGLEFGIGGGMTVLFKDRYEHDRYNPAQFCLSDNSPGGYGNHYAAGSDNSYPTGKCKIKGEWMQRVYLRTSGGGLHFEGEVQHSTAYRNALYMNPEVFDIWTGEFWYSATATICVAGGKDCTLSLGGTAERYLGWGPTLRWESAGFALIATIATDPEERIKDRQTKLSIGGSWNILHR